MQYGYSFFILHKTKDFLSINKDLKPQTFFKKSIKIHIWWLEYPHNQEYKCLPVCDILMSYMAQAYTNDFEIAQIDTNRIIKKK